MYYDYTTIAQQHQVEPSIEALQREYLMRKPRVTASRVTTTANDTEAVRAEWISRAARYLRFA